MVLETIRSYPSDPCRIRLTDSVCKYVRQSQGATVYRADRAWAFGLWLVDTINQFSLPKKLELAEEKQILDCLVLRAQVIYLNGLASSGLRFVLGPLLQDEKGDDFTNSVKMIMKTQEEEIQSVTLSQILDHRAFELASLRSTFAIQVYRPTFTKYCQRPHPAKI